MLFGDTLEEVSANALKTSRSPSTIKSHCKRFSALWGSLPVEQPGFREIEEWKSQRLTEVAPATVESELAFLSRVFRWAYLCRYRPDNPMTGVVWPKFDNRQKRWLSEEEERIVLSALDPADASLVRFAIVTMLRGREQFQLRKNDICFAKRFAHVREGKNKSGRQVPLTEEALGIAATWIRSQPAGPWLFHGQEPDRLRLTRKTQSRVLSKAKRAGVDSPWRIYRRTGASRMANNNVSLHRIGAILGHKNPTQTLRYAWLLDSSLHDAVLHI